VRYIDNEVSRELIIHESILCTHDYLLVFFRLFMRYFYDLYLSIGPEFKFPQFRKLLTLFPLNARLDKTTANGAFMTELISALVQSYLKFDPPKRIGMIITANQLSMAQEYRDFQGVLHIYTSSLERLQANFLNIRPEG